MVPVASRRVSRAPRYSGTSFESGSIFAYVAITLYGPSFQRASTNDRIGNSTVAGPTTPVSPEGDTGLGCSDFARHYFRNRGFFLFLQVLRWFTSLGLLVPDYGFIGPYGGFTPVGFPIRKSPDQSLLAAPRGLSQLATSFIACLLPRHPPCALSSLTIKFTRQHSDSSQLSACEPLAKNRLNTPRKLYGALIACSSQTLSTDLLDASDVHQQAL